ncbi:MAG: hypothetical protein ABIP95_10520 [Pelobium sp.]
MIKKAIYVLVLSFLFLGKAGFAQDNKDFMSKSIDGYIHLYYDVQYCLVDESCEFKTYTRVTKYDKAKGGFNGFFTDYYNNNQPALTGTYLEGKKNGEFKFTYPNGKVKSSIFYNNNIPEGKWRYFYLSGNPWLEIEFKNQIPYLISFWDEKGMKRIENGKGKLKLSQPVLDFNEFGFINTIVKGSLKNGRPDGIWQNLLGYPKAEDEVIGNELYNDGEFVQSQYTYPPNIKTNQSLISMVPFFYPLNAETMIYKGCTVDENQNYNIYLQNYLNTNLPLIWTLKNAPDIDKFTVKVEVRANGQSAAITFPDEFPILFANSLKIALSNIPYWIPSFKDGKTIDDVLEITLYKINLENDVISFGYPIIKRNNGR